MINEEIVGGLISALSRGEPLEKAMMTFYNAGYKKEEIEESAKEVYRQLGAQAMGISSSLQETLNEIAIKAGVDKKSEEKKEDSESKEDKYKDSLQVQKSSPKKVPDITSETKENKIPQNVSNYIQSNPYGDKYQNADDITDKIVSAIKGLKQVNIPSRIEIVQRSIEDKPSSAVQRVSDYSSTPQKSVSKGLTFVLIGILILLMCALAGVFLFKEDLIKFFNNIGLG